jgi:dipeptidase E
MADKRLLLISNGSEIIGGEATEFGVAAVRDFLRGLAGTVFFVPFATVVHSCDGYAESARRLFGPAGFEVVSAHEAADPKAAAGRADLVAVGGGNTFKLLREMYDAGLVETIRGRCAAGTPYVGWSAGANVACPTIMTTNDMPIAEPPTLRALGLVPFQINPHYTDARLQAHRGETRDERLTEFVHANPGVRVVGLREGTMLRVEGRRVRLVGDAPPRLFVKGTEPRYLAPSEPLDFLLEEGNADDAEKDG